MQDITYIETVDQARSLLQPLRLEILRLLDRPRTCPDLGRALGESPQKIYYHIKALEKAGVVEKIAERRVRGTVEGHYQARARSVWLAPHLVESVGGPGPAQDQASLRYLTALAQAVLDDVGRLAQASAVGDEVPSLALSGQIHLPDPARRAEFMAELQTVFERLARKYGQPADDSDPQAGQTFRLALACYPFTPQT